MHDYLAVDITYYVCKYLGIFVCFSGVLALLFGRWCNGCYGVALTANWLQSMDGPVGTLLPSADTAHVWKYATWHTHT